MSDIQNVDYEAFPAQAAQIRSYAQELNTELTNAYTNITNMHNVWYGKRYNSLVTSFNNIIPQLNQLLDLVVGEIPYAIETAANNYSNVDEKGNIVSAQNTPSNKIAEIPVINDVGLRFMPADVSDIQNQVSTNLDNSKSKMD